MKTAVLLSGGGSSGALQDGMVEQCVEMGVVPDMVLATSVGCLNGMMWYQGDLKKLRDIWLSIRNKDVYKFGPLELATAWNRQALYDSTPLLKTIEKYVRQIDVQPFDFRVTVTDRLTGKAVSHKYENTPDKARWLYASASPPLLMPPVLCGKRWNSDGGVTANYNVRFAVKMGADRIIVLLPRSPEHCYPMRNILDASLFLMQAASGQVLEHELEFVEMMNAVEGKRHIEIIIVKPEINIPNSILDFDLGSTAQRLEYIERGRQAAAKALAPFY